MRALTVQQPWAWAIVHGGKDVENRTQAWSYRGPLAIHAGARWSEDGGRSGLVWDALRERYGWPTGPVTARDDRRPGFDVIRPLGAIIGVVDLVDVHHAGRPDPCDCGSTSDYHPLSCARSSACCGSEWAEASPDVVHLVLENPRPLEVPIPCKGRLGLWTPPADVLEPLQAVAS
jgi:hypothetical protein